MRVMSLNPPAARVFISSSFVSRVLTKLTRVRAMICGRWLIVPVTCHASASPVQSEVPSGLSTKYAYASTFSSATFGRSQNKVSILHQHCFGIGVTAFFGAGHRVSTDKVSLQCPAGDFFVDAGLHTSDVSQDRIIMQEMASPASDMQYYKRPVHIRRCSCNSRKLSSMVGAATSIMRFLCGKCQSFSYSCRKRQSHNPDNTGGSPLQ